MATLNLNTVSLPAVPAVPPYTVAFAPAPKKKEDLIQKVITYAQEAFKVMPVISTWLHLMKVVVPWYINLSGSILSLAAIGYSMFKGIKSCSKATEWQEIGQYIFCLIKDLLYFVLALSSVATIIFGPFVSPWILATLTTCAVLLSIAFFLCKEHCFSKDNPSTDKVVIEFPQGTPKEKIDAVYNSVTQALSSSSTEAPARPLLARALSA
jgi:hypothetical protein